MRLRKLGAFGLEAGDIDADFTKVWDAFLAAQVLRHPLVRSHPLTGRKALYAASGSSFGIEGMPRDEAIGLLDELKRHATQEKYRLRLKYGVGDVVIWDNASLLHSATLTAPDDPRTLWRITIKEETPS